MTLTKELLVLIKSFFRFHPKRVMGILLLMMIISATESISLLLLLPLLQFIQVEAGQGNLGGTGVVTQFLEAAGIRPSLAGVLCLYALAVSLRAFLYRWEKLGSYQFQQGYIQSLRQRLYEAILQSNWLSLSRARMSDFNHALTLELERVETALSSLLYLFIQGIVTLVYIGLALFMSPLLSLMTLGCAGVVLGLLRRQRQSSWHWGEEASQVGKALYAAIQDHLSALKVTKSYGATQKHAEAFSHLGQRYAQVNIAASRSYADASFYFALASVFLLALFVYLAFSVWKLNTATILVMLYIFARIMPAVSSVQSSYQQLLATLPAFGNIMTLLKRYQNEAEPQITHPQPLSFNTAITLETIGFRYQDKPTLENISLLIPKGQIIALLGPSGAGKSTLADLIAGILTPTVGQIWIDETVLSSASVPHWQHQIGYVMQDTLLLHDTLRANLLLAKPEATEADLYKALEQAALLEFVHTLPLGLETVLGDRGLRFSGGERQRLALARALLRKPALLILDEATSALDNENENRIVQVIQQLRGQVTVLLITHRLAMVQKADQIVVLDQGRIVASGSFQSLLDSSSYVQRLYQQTVSPNV